MFNQRTKIKGLLQSGENNDETTVMGWVRSFRNNQFIALNDGSTNTNLQVVAPLGLLPDETLKRITTGACIKATGKIVASQGKGANRGNAGRFGRNTWRQRCGKISFTTKKSIAWNS